MLEVLDKEEYMTGLNIGQISLVMYIVEKLVLFGHSIRHTGIPRYVDR